MAQTDEIQANIDQISPHDILTTSKTYVSFDTTNTNVAQCQLLLQNPINDSILRSRALQRTRHERHLFKRTKHQELHKVTPQYQQALQRRRQQRQQQYQLDLQRQLRRQQQRRQQRQRHHQQQQRMQQQREQENRERLEAQQRDPLRTQLTRTHERKLEEQKYLSQRPDAEEIFRLEEIQDELLEEYDMEAMGPKYIWLQTQINDFEAFAHQEDILLNQDEIDQKKQIEIAKQIQREQHERNLQQLNHIQQWEHLQFQYPQLQEPAT